MSLPVQVYELDDATGASRCRGAGCDDGDALAGGVAGMRSRAVRNEGRGWRKKSLRPPVTDGSSRRSWSGYGVMADVTDAWGGRACVLGARGASRIRPGGPLASKTTTTWEYADDRSRMRSGTPRTGRHMRRAGRAGHTLNSLEPAEYPKRIRVAGRFVRADAPVFSCIRSAQ